ncbi:MAG: hypothetical protein ACUVX8_06995 [Candidatus Zipacnadales bacterium]
MIHGVSQWGDANAARLEAGELTIAPLLAATGYHMGHVGGDHVKQEPPLRGLVNWAKFVSLPEYDRYRTERGLKRLDWSAYQKPCPTRFGDKIQEVCFSALPPGRHPFEPADYLVS